MMWQAQSKIFAENPPQVVDLLPGANPQKDRLTLEKPPLLITEAIVPTPWRVVSTPVARQVRRARTAAVARFRARQASRPEAAPAPARRLTGEVTPGSGAEPAWRLELEPAVRRYLAAVLGRPSPDAMAASWAPADEWWVVGSRPSGLVRLHRGGGHVVARDVVLLDQSTDPRALAGNLAGTMNGPIRLDGSMVFESAPPWPRSWRQSRSEPRQALSRPGSRGRGSTD
jgi:hypothetical protein